MRGASKLMVAPSVNTDSALMEGRWVLKLWMSPSTIIWPSAVRRKVSEPVAVNEALVEIFASAMAVDLISIREPMLMYIGSGPTMNGKTIWAGGIISVEPEALSIARLASTLSSKLLN